MKETVKKETEIQMRIYCMIKLAFQINKKQITFWINMLGQLASHKEIIMALRVGPSKIQTYWRFKCKNKTLKVLKHYIKNSFDMEILFLNKSNHLKKTHTQAYLFICSKTGGFFIALQEDLFTSRMGSCSSPLVFL